jgi:hypothetical protein
MGRYDDRGYETEEAYYGIDSQPTLHRDGYFKLISPPCTHAKRDRGPRARLGLGRTAAHQLQLTRLNQAFYTLKVLAPEAAAVYSVRRP